MVKIEDAFLCPLILFSRFSAWTFTPDPLPPGGRPEVVYQAGGPQFYSAAEDIVPYVRAAAEAVAAGRDPDVLPVPGTPGRAWSTPPAARLPGGLRARYAPADPLARVFWRFWPEVVTAAEAATLPKPCRPGGGVTGFTWTVWYGPGVLDAAFQMRTKDGKVVGVYDLDRRPLADLPAGLSAPADIAAIIAAF